MHEEKMQVATIVCEEPLRLRLGAEGMPAQFSDASGAPFLQPSLPDSDESKCGKPDWIWDIGDDALS